VLGFDSGPRRAGEQRGSQDKPLHRLIRRRRSAGLMMSVRRMPNLSLTTTTSPWAMRQPLTSTSYRLAGQAVEFHYEPCASCSRLRMAILVRPSFHGEVDRDVEDQVEVIGGRRDGVGIEAFEYLRLGRGGAGAAAVFSTASHVRPGRRPNRRRRRRP